MTNRKILALILVVAAVIVIVVVFATVFSVRYVTPVYYNEKGERTSVPDDSPSGDSILQLIGRRNILFMSKSDALDLINQTYTTYHAVAITKSFPNKIEVHMVERVAVYKLNFGSGIYLDSFGCIIASAAGEVIDITQVFNSKSVVSTKIGEKVSFNTQSDNERLEIVLQTVNSIWQLHYAYDDIPKVLYNIEFDDGNTTMTLTTQKFTKIVVYEPKKNLPNRLINAFSVYYNSTLNLQHPGVVITVGPDGYIWHSSK